MNDASQPHQADDILMASSMTIAHCEHGTVYIRFYDEAGNVFAVGAMPIDTAVNAAQDLTNHIEAAMKEAADPAQALGCAGHA